MTIKHTHPEYQSEAQRQERLKDVKKVCASLIRPDKNRERAS